MMRLYNIINKTANQLKQFVYQSVSILTENQWPKILVISIMIIFRVKHLMCPA